MFTCSKKNLSRPLALAGLAAAFALAIGAKAQADFSDVRSATVRTSTGGATTVSPISVVAGNTNLGEQFINNVGTAPPAPGGTGNVFGMSGNIRVIGSNFFNTYNFTGGGGVTALYNGNPVVTVFALGGTVNGPTSMFAATTGRVGVFQLPAGTSSYNQFNPLSWGAVNATGTALLAPIAVWDIKPPEFVTDTNGGPGIFNNLTPAQVNQISINTAVGQFNQGNFLFRETTTFTGPTLEGNDYANVPNHTTPPGTFFVDEGLISQVNEAYSNNPNTSFVSSGVGSAGFDALNTIAKQLGSLADLGGSAGVGTAFATGFGGAANSDFTPAMGGPPPSTSDLYFTLATQSSATIEFAVPEPASVTLMMCGGLAAGMVLGLRRRRAKLALAY